jgi:hypothetical protein
MGYTFVIIGYLSKFNSAYFKKVPAKEIILFQVNVGNVLHTQRGDWRLCWRHDTAFPLCAITAFPAAFPSPSGTATKHPHSTCGENKNKLIHFERRE